MLVSETHKFLFVHIQKTAGTSITHYLKNAVPDVVNVLRPHDPLFFAEESMGLELKNYYKIGFVRNPFDRLVSWYSMIIKNGKKLSESEKKSSPNYNKIWQHVLCNSNSFDEFVLNCSNAQDRSGWRPFLYNQVDYLKDCNGVVAADFIGRFESINEDTRLLFSTLKVANHSIPHINKSEHNNYRKYYTSQTRKIVEQRFEHDLNFFSYDF